MSVPDETELESMAVDLVLALMASASTDKIRPLDWWTRARSAIETGAETGTSFGHLVSVAAGKLQVEVLRRESASRIFWIGSRVGEPSAFEALRDMISREGLYIVAGAQLRRDEQRVEAGERRADEAPIVAQLHMAREAARRHEIEMDRMAGALRGAEEDNRVLRDALALTGAL